MFFMRRILRRVAPRPRISRRQYDGQEVLFSFLDDRVPEFDGTLARSVIKLKTGEKVSPDLVRNEDMDEGAFVRSVIMYTAHIPESDLLDFRKKGRVKREVYECAGRAYFLDDKGYLSRRFATPYQEIAKAFIKDYQRLFPNGRAVKQDETGFRIGHLFRDR